MENTSLVSVIIPVYNCERYINQAIESVLAQTYQPLEIIVVDDGSTDASADRVKSFEQVKYYYQPNKGAAAARNFGIEVAQGNIIAFLDADDFWVEDKLSRQIAIFNHEPGFDIVFGNIQQFHSPELDEEVKNKINCPTELMAGYHPGTMLIKRETFLHVGLFETNWQVGEFISWYSRASDLGIKTKMLPELLMWRRLHENNMGIRQRHARNDYARLIKASLDRRRAIDNSK